jgi:hypothetical protein
VRERAGRACAPLIGLLADWPEAVTLLRSGAVDQGLRLARGATSGLDAYGERYTGARLLVDLLPGLDAPACGDPTVGEAPRVGAIEVVRVQCSSRSRWRPVIFGTSERVKAGRELFALTSRAFESSRHTLA